MELQELLKNDNKVYVEVNTNHKADGTIYPRSFVWEDGHLYKIDKVIDVRRAASTKAGGVGLRYTVRIQNKDVFMFLEETGGVDRWFMERK